MDGAHKLTFWFGKPNVTQFDDNGLKRQWQPLVETQQMQINIMPAMARPRRR
jgi:hypothetical protein